MNIPWDDVQLFLAIAETGSLSAAAKRLRLGQPTVSRRLVTLEGVVGHALFRRQASGTSLTSAGERLVAPARRMAEWAGEVTRAASTSDRAPRGVVRVAAPPGVAFDFVAPFAAWLRERHPHLRLEVLSTVHYLDLARGEADLALRLRRPPEGDLTTLASVTQPIGVFAAESYARKLPRRYGLRDLDWICWAPPFEDVTPNPQLQALVPGFTPAFTSDNYLVQWRAAEAGVGAMVLGVVKHRFVRPTPLVKLRVELGAYGTADLHLVCAKSALDIARVGTVAQLLVAELQRLPRT